MKRRIIITGDGSTTIQLEEWNEQYHSKHGAIQEAYHVFIEKGLKSVKGVKINILEIGFGTGLNALITYLEAVKRGVTIDYLGVEAYPVANDEITLLNYIGELGDPSLRPVFEHMHAIPWECSVDIPPNFSLKKQQSNFLDLNIKDLFNLIYFDAFGPRVQPELWTTAMFQKMYQALQKGGVLVTYSAKGSVRRAMQEVGFMVERLPGPPGKREMLRATKM